MALFKFENLWKIMRNQTLVFVGDVPNGLQCAICAKIMIDPYITECGCQFCFSCIVEKFNKETEHCPGGKEECKEEYLILEKNIVRDLKTRHSISHLIVKCTNESCSSEIELRMFEDHFRICERNSQDCPYKTIGCSDEGNTERNITDHLHKEIFIHSCLLMETINHCSNDVKKLNQIKFDREKDEKKLREEHENNKILINELREELKILKKYIKNEITEEKMKIDSLQLKEAQKEIKKSYGKEVGTQADMTIMDFRNLLKKEVEKFQREISNIKGQVKKNMMELENINLRMKEMKLIHDFVWTIDDFSNKKGKYYDSNLFHKDNYTACLRMWIDGYNLHLFFWLREGELDDFAEWPMKYSVILSILNQDTLRVHSSATYKYGLQTSINAGFNKPLQKLSDYIGGMKISRSDIENISGLLSNNTIMVACSLV